MVRGDCLFAATGVTTGAMLRGVRFRGDIIETETVVMRSITGTVRWIRAEHRQLEKFHLWIEWFGAAALNARRPTSAPARGRWR